MRSLMITGGIEACVDETVRALWCATGSGGVFAGESIPAGLRRRAPRFYVGVDLGQSQDYSAITVVERDEIVYPERDAVTYAFRSETRFHLRAGAAGDGVYARGGPCARACGAGTACRECGG